MDGRPFSPESPTGTCEAWSVTPASILLALMLSGLWVVVVSLWRLRNWRAAALAGIATGAILACAALPWPSRPAIQTAIWTAALYVFLFRSDLVAVMSAKEYQFVEDYVRIVQGIGRLGKRARETDSASYLAQWHEALRSLERLEAPGDWARLQAKCAGELRRRLTAMTLLVWPSPEMQNANAARWLEVEQLYRELLKAKAGFWTGWPPARVR